MLTSNYRQYGKRRQKRRKRRPINPDRRTATYKRGNAIAAPATPTSRRATTIQIQAARERILERLESGESK